MPQVRKHLEHGFGPCFDRNSRVLILGSFPSVLSREQGFFYGHPRNRFWSVLSAVCGERAPDDVPGRQAYLHRHGIALYDVIESCSIIGSSDSSISDVVLADLQPILDGSSIGGHIFTNGVKASSLYRKHLEPLLSLPATPLPSTSPANAACSLDALIAAWTPPLRAALSESESRPDDEQMVSL